MSQLTHRTIALQKHGNRPRAVWLGAILAMTAVAAAVLILALDGGSSSAEIAPAGVQTQLSVRPDAGPEESRVAAVIGSRAVSRPDESAVAAAIGSRAVSRPDESAVAAAIAGR